MAITSFTTLRRFAGIGITLLFCLCLPGNAFGQDAGPLVTASSVSGLDHPTGWGTIVQSAVDSDGNWLVVDFPNGALYEFPADGSAMKVLVASGGLGSANGYQNPSILLDASNDLFLGGNWSNCLLMFPYDSGTKTWPGLSALNGAASSSLCGKAPYSFAQYGLLNVTPAPKNNYFQPFGLAMGPNNTLVIGDQGGPFIFSLGVVGSGANAVPGTATAILNGLLKRPMSIATDPEGNIYFVEDSGGLSGVYKIPAGSIGLTSDCAVGTGPDGTAPPFTSTCLTRVDPGLLNVKAVVTDPVGNLYISDSQKGVVMVPNSTGTPEPDKAVIVTTVPAQGEVAFDITRSTMYVPTSQTQLNKKADVAKIGLGHAEFGMAAVGTTPAAATNVIFGFSGSVTPDSFAIVEAGVQKPDFAITGGTCTTGTESAALTGCLQGIAFTPSSVGSISAKLLMLDDKQNVLSSIMLHGTGTGANIQVTPAIESTRAASLTTPNQIAVDLAGNSYIADSGQGKVLMFAPGATTPVAIGTSLTAPTGVAVDGAGDVFIADSGNVYEVPFGPTGLSAAGQVQLVSGLGANLNLAVDGFGTLYIADPTNSRLVKLSNIGASTAPYLGQSEVMLTAGFTAPSAVATDVSGNLYVIDGSNLLELAGGVGKPATLLNNLSGATGLALDPSGAVYITSTSGTVRIPSVGGVLAPDAKTTLASDVTTAASVALDRAGNVYLVPGSNGITVISVNGTATLPTPADLTSSTTSNVTVTNVGNAPLLVTGYKNSSTKIDTVTIADFTAADGTCVGDSTSPGTGVAVGGTCEVAITFNPQSGEEGTLSGQITINSNSVTAPITIATTAEGLSLAGTAANITATGAAEVVSTAISVTVAPKTKGGPVPTGTVALTFPSWTVVVGAAGPAINPVPITVPATLDANGKATFQIAPVLAGAQSFTVGYVGDRVYGRSIATVNATVAKSAIAGIALPKLPDASDVNLPFAIADNGQGTTPYDGTVKPWQYQFIMNVNTAFGVPTGTITVMDDSTKCPSGTSAGGLGVAACVLVQSSGPACPQKASAAILTIQNAGTASGAQGSFDTGCLWAVPQGTTYSPVLYTHYVHPEYSGDANFLASKGDGTLFQSVRGPMVQITQTGNAASATTAPTLTVTAGSSASIDLTLTPLLGYGFAGRGGQLNNSNFPVSLTCDIPIPHAQCAVTYDNSVVDPNQITAPNSVQIPCPANVLNTQLADGSVQCTPGHAKVTFYTDVTTGTTTAQNARVTAVTLAGIFGFGMIGLFFRRRSFEKARMLMMAILMVVGIGLAVSLTACSTTNLNSQTVLNSPAGTYNVTITAQEVGTQCISAQGDPNSNCTTSSGGTGRLVFASSNQVSLPFYVIVKVQ